MCVLLMEMIRDTFGNKPETDLLRIYVSGWIKSGKRRDGKGVNDSLQNENAP